mmetsp:Transcript_36156/g.114981  ORF Transcript_36156/g.114981 Transcript_36156/m.114981 type:complete len:214 (+) Transcript_36156:257-898(+)
MPESSLTIWETSWATSGAWEAAKPSMTGMALTVWFTRGSSSSVSMRSRPPQNLAPLEATASSVLLARSCAPWPTRRSTNGPRAPVAGWSSGGSAATRPRSPASAAARTADRRCCWLRKKCFSSPGSSASLALALLTTRSWTLLSERVLYCARLLSRPWMAWCTAAAKRRSRRRPRSASPRRLSASSIWPMGSRPTRSPKSVPFLPSVALSLST